MNHNNPTKGYKLSLKLAELDMALAATGTTVSTLVYGNPDIFSLVMLGLSLGFFSFDSYQLYQIDKLNNEKQNNKQKVKK